MTGWDRRIERARILEREYPAAAELLRFYREIAGFQRTVAQAALPGAPVQGSARPVPAELREFVGPLLRLLERVSPPPLAGMAAAMRFRKDWDPADPATQFVNRVLLQPYTEGLARRQPRPAAAVAPACPFCGEQALAAILRPEGEGGKRSLLCALCFTEWEFRRLWCPRCGEEDHQKLPIFTAEPFPHIRIEACDTCRTYLKSIDLTRNGLAVPEVDEIAALPLDLWAGEHGYGKLQTNLFGL